MKKIDLDALEAAIAKCPERPWRWNRSDMGQIQVSGARHARQVCAVWNSPQYPATKLAAVITASVNAIPDLIAELRELRALVTQSHVEDKK